MLHGSPSTIIQPKLQLVAWEVTRSCNLSCAHCRASANSGHYAGELDTRDCYGIIDQILEVGKPVLILTGGEPLIREDIFSIAEYAVHKGLRVVMGSNGTLITPGIAAKLKAVPLSRVSVSLDFPSAELQDKFRGQPGAYDAALAGIENLRRAGIDIQVNCTLTKLNIAYLADLIKLAIRAGAVAFHPFFLVPTGRGKGLEQVELSANEYEKALNWIYDKQLELGSSIFFKPTDAPHYLRVMKQRQKLEGQAASPLSAVPGRQGAMHTISRGCLAGTGFCFISHVGKVQGCGYLEVEAGDLKKQPFALVWADSPLFTRLRDLANLKGKCGGCEYKQLCGGCRARAFETSGDYLEAEPYCLHQPATRNGDNLNA
jgi:heme b synthase